jgi:hypothetical protein
MRNTGPDYEMMLAYCKAGDDVMSNASWAHYSEKPVVVGNGVDDSGPGHNGWFSSPDGTHVGSYAHSHTTSHTLPHSHTHTDLQTWVVYHGTAANESLSTKAVGLKSNNYTPSNGGCPSLRNPLAGWAAAKDPGMVVATQRRRQAAGEHGQRPRRARPRAARSRTHTTRCSLATPCCCAPAGGPRRGPGAPRQHRAGLASVHLEGGSVAAGARSVRPWRQCELFCVGAGQQQRPRPLLPLPTSTSAC